MSNVQVSVIIPCYNQGHFLQETLDSLKACDQRFIEIIIVNDGSTDSATIGMLNHLKAEGYTVIFQENKGLGEARNTGIRNSTAPYILPLDSDNKIHPQYITKGINILDSQADISVVYGNANLFGDKSGILTPGQFNLQRLMVGNYIDACALIRRSSIEAVGLYDKMEVMGYEDWDLWLRFAFAGYKFYYVDETLFDYRVVNNSMMRTLNANIRKQNWIEEYFSKKYADKLDFAFLQNHFIYTVKKKPLRFMYTLLLKKFFGSYYEQKISENKMYRGFLHRE